ncbi:TPA: hypothetical protein O4E02_003999, partial [Proteus mirabilis]|nr:hypothetical protein [Proteus mirabilis]
MKLLLTPYIQKELGVVLLKPGAELLEQFRNHQRVIISDVPQSLDVLPSGALTGDEQPILNNKHIVQFLNNKKVIHTINKVSP